MAAKALIAWRLVYMLLQDRQKTGLSSPAVNAAEAQDGGSKVSPPSTNNVGSKVVGEDKMARDHCMPRGDKDGVGKHLVAWDNAGGAVGGAVSGNSWEGPPKYTPLEATPSPGSTRHDIIDTSTSPHVTAPPMSHGHALALAFDPAYTGQHGRAHVTGPEAYPPKVYPPLPPRPHPTRGLPGLVSTPAPEKPQRPEVLAKPQAPPPSLACRQLSIKASRTRYNITHTPTQLPKRQNIETQVTSRPPALSSHVGESASSSDSEMDAHTPPLTRLKRRTQNRALKPASNHMHNASAPRCNTFPVGADDEAYAFHASATTQAHEQPSTQIEVVHEIIEAQEKAWKTVHEQAALAGDLDMLRAFPVHLEEGRPPQWRPISYPVLKDIKKAIAEHDLSSPYTISLLESFFNAFDLTPNDIRQVTRAWKLRSQSV